MKELVRLGYLDPGSGSLLLQALLGGIAALGVTAKLWYGRVARVLRIRRVEREEETP